MTGFTGKSCAHGSGRFGAGWAVLTTLLAQLVSVASQGAEPDRLAREIDAVLAGKGLRGATVGVHVASPASGRVLCSRNGMTKLIVASNQKILTAATALRELGPRYEFETALFLSGEAGVDGGTLEGDLILRGGGDPTLGSWWVGEQPVEELERWAGLLAAAGVRRVTGDVVADDTFFDRQRVHPDWPSSQLHRPYCAPVSGLSLMDNCLRINVSPGARVGEPAILSLATDIPALTLTNRCSTLAKRPAIWFKHEPGSLGIEVHGRARHGSGVYVGEVTAPEPALLAAGALEGALRRKGITVQGKVRLADPTDVSGRAGWRRLAVRRTPLPKVLRVMLKSSNNMYAEHVIKTVGAETEGTGSWQAGLAQTEKMLRGLYFREHEFELADGSGLSRDNRLPAALMSSVLTAMDHSEHRDVFRGLFPVSGEDGSLAGRLADAGHKGKVRAKTGYLQSVGALSGYAETAGGKHLVFSILINDFKGGNAAMKEIEDRIARAIVDYAE